MAEMYSVQIKRMRKKPYGRAGKNRRGLMALPEHENLRRAFIRIKFNVKNER